MLKGLPFIVAEMRNRGYSVLCVSEGEVIKSNVTSVNAKAAALEVDEVIFEFWKDRKRDWIYVIAGNDDDWLCNYRSSPESLPKRDIEEVVDLAAKKYDWY